MNIEQKAKAYDEALETARQIHNGNPSSGTAIVVCEQIFPELKESEDERIRKFLVGYFTSYKIGNVTTKLNGYRIDDIIAYLEKQKNLDKMIVVSPEVWDGAINDAYENGKKDSEKQKEQKPVDLSKMMVHKEPYIAPVPTPMVADEQKPIVLSDKFEVALEEFLMNARDKSEKTFAEDVKEYADRLREIVINEKKEQKHPNGCFTCDEYKKGYEEGRRNGFTAGYNKAMKEVEQKEQKPVVTHGETYHVDTLGTQQVIAGKMPQKPAEWSEEDEKMRNLIVTIFEVNHPDGFFKANELGTTDMRGVHTEEIVSWLKSLRPSWKQTWKPTEKEITALENLMKGEFPNKIFPGATLSELLNKLKKLYYNESIPSWKPSEEQIYAIVEALKYLPNNKDEWRILNTLVDVFKKLM